MGMFDKEKSLTKSDHKNNDFVLWSGQFLGTTKSADYGENVKARVQVSANKDAEREDYVVFGVMADQINRLDSGDLPAIVRIGKDGRANVFELVSKLDS